MKRNVTILLLSLFAVTSSEVHGQLSVINSFITSINISTASMFNVTVVNSSPNSIQATLQVSLINSGNEIICSGKTFPFTLQPGMNNVSTDKIRIASFIYGASTQASFVKTSHTLPSGNFKYCATLITINGIEPSIEFCKDLESFTISYLHLISPSNEEIIPSRYPVLIWTHSEPFSSLSSGEFFRIIVTEMEQGQNPEASVTANRPIFFKDFLKTHNIPYSLDAPELVPQKHYAWQVQKISNGVIFEKTEAWEFRLELPESTDHHQYYKLKSKAEAGFCEPVDNMLYFSFEEGYNSGDPECAIYDFKRTKINPETKNDNDEINQSSEIKKVGDNRFAIDLSPYHLKKGFYNLEVRNVKNDILTLKFFVK